MPSQKWYSFHPSNGKHHFRDVHDQVSIQAYYAFELLNRHRVEAPFTFEQIEKISLAARRFHSGEMLKKCLSQLVTAKALIVETRSDRVSAKRVRLPGRERAKK
jgi:hypothetical protein